MNIVFLDADTVGDVSNLGLIKEYGNLTVYGSTSADQVVSRLQEADIALTNKVALTKTELGSLPSLKLICITATGMNNVNLDYAKAHQITVKNAAGYSTNSVAQHTMASILYLLHRPDYYDQYVKSGRYSSSNSFTHYGPPFHELAKKEFGIIGLGAIGSRVASIASAFGASVCYYSTSGKHDNPEYERLELDDLLARCDVVSIHAPLNENTQKLIRYPQIRKMKADAILVNTGRGGIVDENDLAAALNAGYLRGVCLDVFEEEPIRAGNPLLKVKAKDKLVLTPHVAWTSREAREELLQITANNIREFLEKS
jgi:glycerate dehydrogenase